MTNRTHLLGGDLPVHRIGLGTMRLADGPDERRCPTAPVWQAPTDRNDLVRLVRTAVDRGVDLVDTADAYALGAGEELVGEALAGVDRPVAVSTKVGVVRPSPDEWVPLGHPAYLRQQAELSLRRLGRDTIDLLSLHRVDDAYPLEDQVGALARLVEEGKVRHLGLSEVTTAQLDAAREVAPIAAVQNLYNVGTRDHDPVVERTRELGVAFVPYFPVSFELRTTPGLVEVATRRGLDPRQVALAWLLHRGPHVVPIPGTTSVEHLAHNLASADVVLDEPELALIDAVGASTT